MITIRATDHDVTVWSDEKIMGQYAFGLTGSDLAEILDELGIEATYQYDGTAEPAHETVPA